MTKEDIHDHVVNSKGLEKGICQICAICDGEIVYEDAWRRYKKESTIQVMSVTKGIMALLTGIAIDRGNIQSTKQRVLDFFPDYQVKRGEKTIYDVTIEHLLTMTAPFKYRSEPWKKVCSSTNWAKAVLDYLGGRSGFSGKYSYTTIGLQILSGIIENATGIKCIDFANEKLFAPLAICSHTLHSPVSETDQRSFMMSKTQRDNEWFADPNGTVAAGWGLTLSACDMAKIGWMLVNDGMYGQTRVLSKEWITQMTAPILRTGDQWDSYYYGYLWYRPYGNAPVYAAIGTRGNLIYVNEEMRIAVGVTGTSKFGMENQIGFVEKYVVPMVEERRGWY